MFYRTDVLQTAPVPIGDTGDKVTKRNRPSERIEGRLYTETLQTPQHASRCRREVTIILHGQALPW
jgi:hypothetical protein